MKKQFKALFKHNAWANYKVLITLENAELKSDKPILLFSHLISSQIVWHHRIKGLPTSPFPLWQKYKISELHTMATESENSWAKYLDEHRFETFEEMIFYTNSKEVTCESKIKDIINHVINHSAHYRGQIACLLGQEGIEPPENSFIDFTRKC